MKPLDTLERIVLRDMVHDDILTLTFLLASYTEPTPLSHLKITTALGISKDTLFHFLESLSHTSVEYLSLYGVGYADAGLLYHIATHAPHLRALTLVYRESPQASSHCWPDATWEYAAALAGFSQLEYFGWNSRVTTAYFPDALPCFESDNYCDMHALSEADDETEGLCALFAAYCPSLAFLRTNMGSDRLFRLRPTVEIVDEERVEQILNTYDPGDRYSWPLLDPDLEPLPWW